MSELRKDPVVDRWVIISPERAGRPQPLQLRQPLLRTEPCPFCAGNEGATPPAVLTLPGADKPSAKHTWSVRVVPNKYPALTDAVPMRLSQSRIYEMTAGVGVHEVIIESPHHITRSQDLSEEQFKNVLLAFAERIRELNKDKRWRQLLVYKNQGAEVGATLEHVHAQLIALPMVPRDVQAEVSGAKRHYDQVGRCIYCDIIAEELRNRARLVFEDDGFIVLCPFASRFAYEILILPRQHRAFFDSEPDENYAVLARALRQVLLRLDRKLGDLPFNYVLHSSPLGETADNYYHWHVEILPKIGQVAGFEWGSGWNINTVPPENAARSLAES